MNSSSKNSPKVKRPSMFWLATEGGRAVAEWGMSLPYRKMAKNSDCGDGHPVLVLPGFLANDTSTKILRKHLENLGYTPYGWSLGRNNGREEFLGLLSNLIETIHEKHQTKVSIIGWSLGGVFARQMAKKHPEKVRQVITLGSPFRGISEPNNVAWLYNLITGGKRVADVDSALLLDLPKPPPVPTTAVYSKQDGVVPWQLCMEAEETAIHQNIEVRGSHLGLGHNPSVLRIISDRLQYSAADWVHFQPRNMVEGLVLYPSFA